MSQIDRKRHLGLFLLSLLALGLLAFAVINVLRWQAGEAKDGSSITVRPIRLSQAPMQVQDAAARLATSRVGYVIPMGEVTYLVISSGEMGQRMELTGAKREKDSPLIGVELASNPTGERLIVAEMKSAVADSRTVHFDVDGYVGALPALINRDQLRLVPLPEKGMLAVVSPEINVRLMGSVLQVSGFTRFPDGRVHIQVFSAGKGRVLGEVTNVVAATMGPDWGSFRASVAVDLTQGVSDGILMIYHPNSDAKMAIPVHFGSK